MKKLNKILTILLVGTIILSGCGNKQEDIKIKQEPQVTEQKQEVTEPVASPEVTEVTEDVHIQTAEQAQSGGITVKELKKKYGVNDNNYIKPFYNVEQTTQFTFHFNSKVEPIEAITVHTDPKCEMNSTVYQINSAYESGSGYDIVVKPGSPVLNTSDRQDGKLENYNWGNAPVYYLSINYDMDATTPTKLDEPIIVPFTIRNEISTPNLTASIDKNGKFQLEWKAVDGAVNYNIYQANRVRESSAAYNMTRSEAGYVGDHLELLATVDGNTLSFNDFHGDGTANTQTDSNGFVVNQNFYDLGSYYVTAIDADGNESYFSMAVTGWQYYSQLPKSFEQYSFFSKNADGYVIYLPESVPVTMADGSKHYFPIEYTKTQEFMYGTAQYSYHIIGTELTGKVEYYKPDKIYSPSITSSVNLNSDLYTVKNNINIIPDVNVNTITDDSYSSTVMNLGQTVQKDESTAVKYSQEELLKRADIENARMVNDGVYTTSDGPLGMLIEGSVSDDSNNTVSSEPVETTAEPIVETTAEPTVETTAEPEIEKSDNDIPSEITSDNLVDEQLDSTKRQIEDANDEVLPEVTVTVFADTAEEEYLALNMIAANEVISLEGFPNLQNAEYLIDVLFKTVYQNPYIIGFENAMYDPNTLTLNIMYSLSADSIHTKQEAVATEAKNIVNSVVTAGMSDEEKVMAIWSYLEENTEYDVAALEYAEQNEFTDVSGFEDSFEAYGIMCKKVGVCQSYAYCYKILLNLVEVPCITLTGYMDMTLPHAWNAVYLDGAWRWIDATNNLTNSGIPYMLYQTSSVYAEKASYLLDDCFELNNKLNIVYNTDNSKDWYVENNCYASSQSELIQMIVDNYSKSDKYVCVKCDVEPTYDEAFFTDLAMGLYSSGISEEEIYNLRMGYTCGIFILMK